MCGPIPGLYFYSVYLLVYFNINITLSSILYFYIINFEITKYESSGFILIFQIYFGYSHFLYFQINFRMPLSIS